MREHTEAQATIHGVVCDMDGTLLGSERVSRRCHQRVAREMGVTLTDADFGAMVGHSRAISQQILADRLGPEVPIMDLLAQAGAAYEDAINAGEVKPLPGVVEGLNVLAELGLPMVVATSTLTPRAESKLAKANLRHYFCAVIGADLVSRPKPAPDSYLYAAELLGLPPQRCLAVEDSPTGLRSAHAAGMITVLIPDLVSPPPAVADLADYHFDSFHQLTALAQDGFPGRNRQPHELPSG